MRNPDGFLAGLGRSVKPIGAAVAKVVVVVLSPLIVAIYIAIVAPIRRRMVRRKYLRLAHEMRLDNAALSLSFRADGLGACYVTGSALREGSWEDVLRTVSDEIAQSGYRRCLPGPAKTEQRRDLQFSPPRGAGLPFLKLSVYLPGEVIGTSGTVVPPGHTGLDYTLA
jgi:hypothetical protein